ncbi:xanthine dehydrogenase [Diachasma alloeum]|uniref:xanthine dehydrogenase n=1 Tax=Diachasma alloeum TaxID=454923 RepID=UPI0007382675|nr:xanthine dehydrogenase [Diachasma alloeum]
MGQGSYTYVGGTPRDTVELTINGVAYTVNEEVRPETSLNVFIRDHALLRGTKYMCLEGGCGACIVAAEIHGETLAVNSCLVPVLICNGWKIKTIEGIGNRKTGYHKIQATLAEMNGSQCGYCSPGMVMNMYSLMQGKEMSMKEIENSFGSNICRCTGYRPILEAFKGLGNDADPAMVQRIQDIEELYKLKTCPKSGKPCKGDCSSSEEPTILEEVRMEFGDVKFQKVLDIDSLFGVFTSNPNASYVLNGGNTAHGVYRLEKPQLYIDLNDISDLRRVEKTADSLILGGNVSLTVIKNSFIKYSGDTGFSHLRQMADHVDLIASVPVRNIGTLAGNLMIKHQHNEFPSDLFLILETAGAKLHILESPGQKKEINFMEFMKMDMKHKIIYSIVLPALKPEHVYRSYKIMPRAQNAHAHVNAGFLLKLDASGLVQGQPNIIFGGIRSDFLHATATENYLTGKRILDKSILKQALETLASELNPDHVLPDYSPEFRKNLAQGLFYKFVLSVKPETVDEKLRSGGTILERDLSSGRVDYETDKSLWPYNKPLPKTESIYQTSGEAEYVNDIPPQPREVFCAFVHTIFSSGKITNIDASEALAMEGVVAFLSAKDVPGKNLAIDSANKDSMNSNDEKLFADGVVEFAGQPIGLICAETHALASEAVKKVKVTYTDVSKEKPIITNQDAIDSGDKNRVQEKANVPADRQGTNPVKKVIKDTFNCGPQYHFTMEPQSCVCIPTEDGMDVYPSSHFIDLAQTSMASCLGIANNRINISVRRLGGSYGAKLSRNSWISCGCAVAAHVLNRPARLIMTIESNMTIIGKRFAVKHDYEIGVDADGVIQYLKQQSWHNAGSSFNDPIAAQSMMHSYSCYDKTTWASVANEVHTDVPSNTYARAPGSTEGVAMAENMMENIAQALGKDPVEVRLNNMNATDKEPLSRMIADIKQTSDYTARVEAVRMFNKENRWKKRGISLMPMKYPLELGGMWNALISVYPRDGTVAVLHGGIEVGQGINTKVAQVAAYTLGIDLDMINVKPTNNLAAPNNTVTGGSISTESAANATITACKELLNRLEPIKNKMTNPTWKELVFAAFQENVNLCVQAMLPADSSKGYPIYAVTVSEVEVDMLTGQHVIRRVDLLEDVGISMNPEIDRGQVEGAFVMGAGYWTSEDLIYDPKSGLLVNNRTWNYKPPGAKDIPVDFRVAFRKRSPNPVGVLRSKAIGEPPLCMAFSIPLALRNALNSARKDAGNAEPWYQFDGPATTENILKTSLTTKDLMVL